MNISEQTHRRVIAFVRNVANDCGECLRRTHENCSHCRSSWANSVLNDLIRDRDNESQYIDYSFHTRVETIKRILAESGRPLLANEIDLKHTCSPQLKNWTLKYMMHKGLIGRKFAYRRNCRAFFRYYTKEK